MCGIVGIWHIDKAQLDHTKLQVFTDALAHRGPDGAGYYIDKEEQLGLGHRRLSILDLSESGKQPMAFGDGRYQVTFNGEIYNFIELRKELSAYGYVFKSESDTEVLAAAYHKWGKQCMHQFNGMFAFAIWDTIEKELFLCRDRFGVKPLFYHEQRNKLFAFASETIAFKSLAEFNKVFDTNSILIGIRQPEKLEACGQTIYSNIMQLPAGCFAIINKSAGLKISRWWNTFDNLVTVPNKFEDQVKEFQYLFEDACKIRLRSDVPVASALSGGVDSSSVYCMINHLMSKSNNSERIPKDWQQAFVGTFPGSELDERSYAESVISFTKGKATFVEPDNRNLVSEIIASTKLFDSITGTPIYAVGNIYRAMKKGGITVSMDGHGADETMFGYRDSVSEVYLDAVQNGRKDIEDIEFLFGEMFDAERKIAAINRLKERSRNEFNLTPISKLKGYLKQIINSREGNRKYIHELAGEWFNNSPIELKNLPDYAIPSWQNASRSENRIRSDFSINHIPYNLRDFDRASMQNGIEIRMPFMDYRVVTYLFSLPLESRLGHGYTKRILREAMKGLMPEDIRTRKLKLGLTAPIANWFNKELNQFILDTVNSDSFLKSNYWNGNLIRSFVEQHSINRDWNTNDASRFWNVLNAHLLLSHE